MLVSGSVVQENSKLLGYESIPDLLLVTGHPRGRDRSEWWQPVGVSDRFWEQCKSESTWSQEVTKNIRYNWHKKGARHRPSIILLTIAIFHRNTHSRNCHMKEGCGSWLVLNTKAWAPQRWWRSFSTCQERVGTCSGHSCGKSYTTCTCMQITPATLPIL